MSITKVIIGGQEVCLRDVCDSCGSDADERRMHQNDRSPLVDGKCRDCREAGELIALLQHPFGL